MSINIGGGELKELKPRIGIYDKYANNAHSSNT